jgi:hypothetical protein
VSRSTTVAALALALFGVALYARSVGFDFVDFDDRLVLLAHGQLYAGPSLLASLRQILWDYFPREEPLLLRDVSWALDARLFGFQNPLGYHLGNVVLNAANGSLLFLFLRRATGRFALALAVSAAWIALPVHVEAVSWVMGRKDVLATVLVLAALLVQASELEQTKPAARAWRLALTLLLVVLALLAKIAAFACVPLLVLHRVFHPYLAGRRAPDEKLDWGRAIRSAALLLPHAAAAVAIVLWYQRVLAKFGVIGRLGPGAFSTEHLGNMALFVPLLVGCYLRSLVWPFGLSAFYRWPHVEIPLSTSAHFASYGIALGVAAGVAYCCLRRRDLAFFALGFFALLLPYLGLVYVDIWRADRYVYLASFALLALAADALARLAARGPAARNAVAALAIAFVTVSATQTFRHQAVWSDNEALWSYEAHLPEPSLISLQALAAEYAGQAERETDPAQRAALSQRARLEAERGIEREAELGRTKTGYKSNEQLQLARLHGTLGRLDRIDGAPLDGQIAHYEESVRLAPYRANTFELAKLYLERALAEPEGPARERLVRVSFQRYLEYLGQSSYDPAWRERNQAFLTRVYERNFPYLGGAVLAARRTYFR